MINLGIVGGNGRAGTIRSIIHKIEDVQVRGYYNYGLDIKGDGYIKYESYDDMLSDTNIDAVIIASYFDSHAELAIKGLRAGKHVLSEITAAMTLGECTRLIEAVEASQRVYALLEPYALLGVCKEIKRFIDEGNCGNVVYGEGEYCHQMSPGTLQNHTNHDPEHWRLHRPCTFYVEHALGPLMYMLNCMPKSVVAMPAIGSQEFADARGYSYRELAGCMLVETDGPLLYVKGCTHWTGRGRYWRINGENGGIEVIRGHGQDLRTHGAKSEEYNVDADITHRTADEEMIINFIDSILGKSKPIFDVYKAVAMSKVAIYGQMSIKDRKIYTIEGT